MECKSDGWDCKKEVIGVKFRCVLIYDPTEDDENDSSGMMWKGFWIQNVMGDMKRCVGHRVRKDIASSEFQVKMRRSGKFLLKKSCA